MGKTVIREYDNSATAASFSSAFAVVVPGYVNTLTYNEDAFDENGIYECSSTVDFINNVGKHPGVQCDAVAPQLSGFEDYLSSYNINYSDYYNEETGKVNPEYSVEAKIAEVEAEIIAARRDEVFELETPAVARKSITKFMHDEYSVEVSSSVELVLDTAMINQIHDYINNGQPSSAKLTLSSSSLVSTLNELIGQTEITTETEIDFVALSDEEIAEFTRQAELDHPFPVVVEGSYGVLNRAIFASNRGHIYSRIEKESGSAEIGYLQDATYRYELVNDADISAELSENDGWTARRYCIILDENRGSDIVVESHIGNQMAYMLLSLGYSVLFKKLDSKSSASEQLANPEYWEPLKDKSIYNFRYITTGGCLTAAAQNQIIQIAEFKNNVTLEVAGTIADTNGRGDIVALCDFDEKDLDLTSMKSIIYSISDAVEKINDSKYASIFGPQVYYNLSDEEIEDFGKNNKFPASFHYLVAAQSKFENYKEWFAVAGRDGGTGSLSIIGTTVKVGDLALNTLAPRIITSYVDGAVSHTVTKCVNLVTYDHGAYYLQGNRTAYKLNDKGLKYSHFLNIRQLCITIKQAVKAAADAYRYDPNSDLLWLNFKGLIIPVLEDMKANQGILDYKFSKVKHDKKALLMTKLRIVPIEAVEDFDMSLFLEDSLEGVVVSADETN